MRRNVLTIILLFAFILCGCGLFGGCDNGGEQVIIATLNCEFLWDGVEPEEGRATFPHKGDLQACREHMEEIAEIIKRYNPDLINLVEVEGEDALNIFNNDFLSGKGYSVHFLQGKDTYTGQDVALL